MASDSIRFEIVGLSQWAWGDGDESHVYAGGGEHEVKRPSKALRAAIEAAADAGVGVNLIGEK